MARKHHGGDIFYGDRISDYDERRAAKPAWGLEDKALETLIRAIPEGGSVLDAPFGTGRFLPHYASRRLSVTGLDISDQMLAGARLKHPELARAARLDVGSATALPYTDDAFDAVVSFRFLSGIVPSGPALASMREFRRVAPLAILQLKCRDEAMEPVSPPAPDQSLGKRFYRHDMDSLFAQTGWRIRDEHRIDLDPTGNRWAFLVERA